MTTITELKKLLFSMILKTPIWLVHLAANQSSVMSIPSLTDISSNSVYLLLFQLDDYYCNPELFRPPKLSLGPF